jgi:hypothetical protein
MRLQGAHQRNEVERAGESVNCIQDSESATRGLKNKTKPEARQQGAAESARRGQDKEGGK